MTAKAFIDTNVWVYTYDDADVAKQHRALETVASLKPSSIVVSAQVLSEFYVVVTRRLANPLPEPDAAGAVRSLGSLSTVALTKQLIDRALDVRARWQTSYWDALIVAAAEHAGCDRILSEDLATGAEIAGIKIENPFAP